ncbi:MAG: hypothetical protein CL608_29860 [Anaerolineaceae bacterium]|nr:hypothetical protein [Anaerolineaceae bacterium]
MKPEVTIYFLLSRLKFSRFEMECSICGDEASTSCASCINRFCNRCAIHCDECNLPYCLTCSDECDSCGTHLCGNCTLTLDICSCCKREFEGANNCANCVAKSWLKLQIGPRCNECQQFCNSDSCNVKTIIDAQTECPICLDSVSANDRVFQYCGIHMVCKDCDTDLHHNKGCPICRKGRSL